MSPAVASVPSVAVSTIIALCEPFGSATLSRMKVVHVPSACTGVLTTWLSAVAQFASLNVSISSIAAPVLPRTSARKSTFWLSSTATHEEKTLTSVFAGLATSRTDGASGEPVVVSSVAVPLPVVDIVQPSVPVVKSGFWIRLAAAAGSASTLPSAIANACFICIPLYGGKFGSEVSRAESVRILDESNAEAAEIGQLRRGGVKRAQVRCGSASGLRARPPRIPPRGDDRRRTRRTRGLRHRPGSRTPSPRNRRRAARLRARCRPWKDESAAHGSKAHDLRRRLS